MKFENKVDNLINEMQTITAKLKAKYYIEQLSHKELLVLAMDFHKNLLLKEIKDELEAANNKGYHRMSGGPG
jgi:hypothetical protein